MCEVFSMNEENFGMVYDSFSNIYSEIEGIMASLYEELQNDPTNIGKSNLLQGLGSVAKRTLDSQMNFVEAYGESFGKESLLTNLDAKKQGLIDALNMDRDRSRS